MTMTYIALLINVISGLFYKNHKALLWSLVATNVIGFYLNITIIEGFFSLVLLAAMVFLYSNFNPKNKILQTTLFLGIISMVIGLSSNEIPGFFNSLIIDKVQLSDLSCSFSMYLHFDKVMAALILYSMTDLHKIEINTPLTTLRQNIKLILLSTAGITIAAYAIGYIKFDPKLPNIFLIWMINNFFCVCFAEEVIFRGFIQRTLGSVLSQYQKIPYLHITHFQGGIRYIFLTSIAGFLYGYIYHRTNKILVAMIVHFGVNLSHFMLFTYPAPVGMC